MSGSSTDQEASRKTLPGLRQLTGELATLLERAEEKVRLLDLAGDLVPSIEWFVYAFVRKEAVLSAQIEGTQATLMDLLEVEASDEEPTDADVAEVRGCVSASNYAWKALGAETGLPVSMRLLSETHRSRLLHGVRGSQKQPGEIRRSQNWIGGTRPGNANFVPPPPQRLGELLSQFERAIHKQSALPPLVRIGLLHVQFETLHPYLDGNGRLGRLLITLLLRHWKLLSRPLLYLSLFLKSHRQEYYRRLSVVRTDGDWEGWLEFFLEGVAVVAEEAVTAALRLHAIVVQSRARLVARDDATVISMGTLRDNAVWALERDGHGGLWVGTNGGLNRDDAEADRFRFYLDGEGLCNAAVHGILEDNAGRLWLSTNAGIDRFDPETETSLHWDRRVGLAGDEFNQGAWMRSRRRARECPFLMPFS